MREQKKQEDEEAKEEGGSADDEVREPGGERTGWKRARRGQQGVLGVSVGGPGDAADEAVDQEHPAEGVPRAPCSEERADGREEEVHDRERDTYEEGVLRGPLDVAVGDTQGHCRRNEDDCHTPERGDRSRHSETPLTQSDTWAGCIVSRTTPRSTTESVSRSSSSRRRAPNASSVRAAS